MFRRPCAAVAILVLSCGATQHKQKPLEPPPIVRMDLPPPPMIVAPSPLPTWNYGAWKAYDFGTFTMASTVNESESAFGAVCGSDCAWFVNFAIECTEGHKYPAMINSPAGSYPIELRCYHLNDLTLMVFDMDDASLGMLEKGGEAGFAVPLESGKFKVSRFSLGRAAEAVSKTIQMAVDKQNKQQEGLKDFTI